MLLLLLMPMAGLGLEGPGGRMGARCRLPPPRAGSCLVLSVPFLLARSMTEWLGLALGLLGSPLGRMGR